MVADHLASQYIKRRIAHLGGRATWRGGVRHRLPHHRTVGRHADRSLGLLGGEPAQFRQSERARLEAGLAARSSQPGRLD